MASFHECEMNPENVVYILPREEDNSSGRLLRVKNSRGIGLVDVFHAWGWGWGRLKSLLRPLTLS